MLLSILRRKHSYPLIQSTLGHWLLFIYCSRVHYIVFVFLIIYFTIKTQRFISKYNEQDHLLLMCLCQYLSDWTLNSWNCLKTYYNSVHNWEMFLCWKHLKTDYLTRSIQFSTMWNFTGAIFPLLSWLTNHLFTSRHKRVAISKNLLPFTQNIDFLAKTM